jgi:tetratricopeptide (TPR) repeat protein
MMWLGDAQAWLDMAERLDSESNREQNTAPTNHHKRNVAHACIGLAFELAYKSLLVAEFKIPEETHSIEKLHNRLKVETQRIVEEWIKEAGWEESGALLKFLDKYMAHPDIKYRLDNLWEKEKRDPSFTLTGMRTIPKLATILYQLVNLGKQNLAEAREMSTPNPPDSQDALNAVLEIIREIAEKSANGNYIYRGEPKYHDKVSSTLYRQYEDDIETEYFEIEIAQGEMLKEAKDYIHETDEEFEILTQLQHYGGKTNLIDFTTDYLVALFFACDGFFDEPGRVILLREGAQRENRVEKPRSVINRVRDQKSIFARPPKGFIEIESDDAINIPEWLKQSMLKHLEKYHDISTKTIYNDLHGFIRVQDLHQSAYTEFFKGVTWQGKKHDRAIKHYTEVIALRPDFAEAYTNRGIAYHAKGDYDRAIEDYNRAIELKPDLAESYAGRGEAWLHLGEWDLAKADLTTAKNMGVDIIASFHYDYKSVADFERVTGIQLPAELAAMLTLQQ